jgi:hypothetical protein
MKKDFFNKRIIRRIAPFLLLCSFLLPLKGSSQVSKVWALGDGEKVFRNDLEHPDKIGNAIWDGKAIRLKGLYNEVLAFQVIVEGGKDTTRSIDVAVRYPANKPSGKSIGGSTVKHGPDGTIEIFSEHYLRVKDSTHPNWFYGSPAAAPKKMTGWIPDALIPADATKGRGGFPVDVLPAQNQGFWVDVELPRDQKAYPSGVYTGNVVVMQAGKVISEIPLEITLLPQYLPDDNKTTVWVFSSDVETYFPNLPKEQVQDLFKFEAQRHRINLVGGFDAHTSRFDTAILRSYKKYLDGTAFTPVYGYHGNGEGVGEKLFPIGMYGSRVLGDTKTEMQQQANLWVDWFQKNAPGVRYFWYITDEPDSTRLRWVKERADWIHSNTGAGKSLPVFTTTAYRKSLDGDVDIWAAYNGVDLAELPHIRQQGGDHWFYNGNRPRYGSVILEGAAVDLRVNSWILYKYGINTHFIWHSTAWKHNGQGPKRHLHQNVFSTALTFINDDMEWGNGDGILFYPGHTPHHPTEDRGLNRVLPSIRLKSIRRGQQDANLLWMAEQKVGKEKVLSLINKVVPKALSEVSMTDPVPWSERGDDYEAVRQELLKLLTGSPDKQSTKTSVNNASSGN